MEVGEDGWIEEVGEVLLMAILAIEDVVTTKMAVEEVVSEYLFHIFFRLYV
jgi:hypothetical protein